MCRTVCVCVCVCACLSHSSILSNGLNVELCKQCHAIAYASSWMFYNVCGWIAFRPLKNYWYLHLRRVSHPPPWLDMDPLRIQQMACFSHCWRMCGLRETFYTLIYNVMNTPQVARQNDSITRSIWKMLGPFATTSRRTPPVLQCHSSGVATVARRQNWSFHCGDVAIFRIFKMATAAILVFEIAKFYWLFGWPGLRRISVPYFVKIGKWSQRYYDFSIFQDGGRRHLGFSNSQNFIGCRSLGGHMHL